MTYIELIRMKNVSLDDKYKEEAVEFGKVEIDPAATVEERILDMLFHDVNPYLRKTSDGGIVKISFSDNDTTFQENFAAFILGEL